MADTDERRPRAKGAAPDDAPNKLQQAAEALIALSDERDAWERLILAAWREGFLEGSRGQWDEGYTAAMTEMKRAQHDMVTGVRLACRRLVPAGEAWLNSVVRNGATEYGGEGRPRVPADLAAIKLAWEARQPARKDSAA
jgi:hypothetical protein